MAMKTPTPQTPTTTTNVPAPTPAPVEQNALAALSGLNLFNIPQPTQATDLFPAVKIPYPIELGDTFPAQTLFKVGLFDGTKFDPLSNGALVSVIAAKEATRKLTTDAEGKKVYERAYASMGEGFGGSAPLFSQHQTDPMAEKGVSYVVAIVQGDAVTLAEIPAFKVMKDFWGVALHQARLQNGMGMILKNVDVTGCQTAGKKDPTKKYLDPKKFNQPAYVVTGPIPVETLKLIATVFEQQKDKFMAWCRR